jgi:hypothetical protein
MKYAILLLMTLALMLAACRDSDEDVLADACTELNELQQAVAALDALGPTATVDQVKDATEKVRDEARDAAQAVRRVEDVRYQDLRDAQDDLRETIDDIDDDEPIAQARAQIQPQVATVLAAREQLTASLNCR